jgi:transcriptional regulator with XRE-family HTH domain
VRELEYPFGGVGPVGSDPSPIRAARALLGWRQEDLSKAAGVGTATIQRIEKSQHPWLATFRHWFGSRQRSSKLGSYSPTMTRVAVSGFGWQRTSGGDDGRGLQRNPRDRQPAPGNRLAAGPASSNAPSHFLTMIPLQLGRGRDCKAGALRLRRFVSLHGKADLRQPFFIRITQSQPACQRLGVVAGRRM